MSVLTSDTLIPYSRTEVGAANVHGRLGIGFVLPGKGEQFPEMLKSGL